MAQKYLKILQHCWVMEHLLRKGHKMCLKNFGSYILLFIF
jgi:hypothetical protein